MIRHQRITNWYVPELKDIPNDILVIDFYRDTEHIVKEPIDALKYPELFVDYDVFASNRLDLPAKYIWRSGSGIWETLRD